MVDACGPPFPRLRSAGGGGAGGTGNCCCSAATCAVSASRPLPPPLRLGLFCLLRGEVVLGGSQAYCCCWVCWRSQRTPQPSQYIALALHQRAQAQHHQPCPWLGMAPGVSAQALRKAPGSVDFEWCLSSTATALAVTGLQEAGVAGVTRSRVLALVRSLLRRR